MKLTDILTVSRIKAPLAATTKEALITELVDVLDAAGDLQDRQRVLSSVLERERTRTTGIGGGLALPHGKSSGVDRLLLAVGKPAAPVDYDAIDGKPVQLAMLLVSPLEGTGPHIQALAHISRLLSVDAFRRKLMAAQTSQDIMEAIVQQEAQE
jgi:mannitol/fructose-specific phosphotransferase system IIA component (Ntr-type)